MPVTKKELMFKDPNIENPHVLGINRLAARATIVPAQKKGVYYRNKEESAMLRSLNGDYKFAYCPADDMPEFYAESVSDATWDTIDVPSMWQYRGYGAPTYPNVYYPMPFDPPYIKIPNPVGYYRRTIHIENPAKHTILHFGGVDNAFYVYFNGEFVGFSKGSRLPSEFDISHLVRKGENLLAVKVFTYSDATYLENQDMLMANGIFRDVYLIETGDTYLWDYRVTTTYNSFTVRAKFHVESTDYTVALTLGDERVELPVAEEISHTFVLKEPKLWNAEEPNLYDLCIELLKDHAAVEVHSKRVGIMHTRVEGNKFLVNEKPIYIKGVNRHEVNCKNGRAITVEQIDRELREIKANNLNAIRLSHYTNNPATYEIASELGLYLMDEADMETHGAGATGDQGFLSKDPEWLDAYKDRVSRMLETNKNETSIFIWSVGNECGRGPNLERCIDMVRDFDSTRENIITQDKLGAYTHFRLIGYYPMSRLAEYPHEGYPVIAIEYAHAMGNSSGTLQDYWDYNYTHEQMAGGFVWEYKSHGFYCEDENGNAFYKYGGDFPGNDYHWGNFCLDGYHMSDGTPKHTWYELKDVSFAAYVVLENGAVRVKNTNDFTTLSAFTGEYEIQEDYSVIRSAAFAVPHVVPHEWFTAADIDLSVADPKPGATYYLNVCFRKDGERVMKKQFKLPIECLKPKYAAKKFAYTTSAKNYRLTVEGENFSVSFEKGMLCRYEKNGKLLLDAPVKPILYRAPMDNDGIRNIVPQSYWQRHIASWERVVLDKWNFNLHDIEVLEQEDKVTVKCSGKLCPTTFYMGFVYNIEYDIFADGIVHMSVKGKPYGDVPSILPRIGFVVPVAKEFRTAEWYGRGPRESYSDSKAAATVSLYKADILDTYTVFDYPQESGNHEDTGFVRVLNDENNALAVSAQGAFAFSFHDFTIEALDAARHKNEIVKSTDYNYLYIDYKMRGLGGKSCGPDPEEAYELHPHTFVFSIVFSDSDCSGALQLARADFGKGTKALSETYTYEKPQNPHELVECNVE